MLRIFPIKDRYIALSNLVFIIISLCCLAYINESSTSSTVIYCFVIVFISYILFLNFSNTANKVIAELQEAESIIKNLQTASDADTFTIAFEDAKSNFSNKRYLGNLARYFFDRTRTTESLEWNPCILTGHKVFTFQDPREFFNEENVYEANFQSIYIFAPSLLTGLGIFFTFIGLAGGITESQLTTSDLNLSVQSLQALLDGAGQAFYTSIFGIFLSLIFSVLMHFTKHQIATTIEMLNKEIDGVIYTLTPETFLNAIGTINKRQLDYTRDQGDRNQSHFEWQGKAKNFMSFNMFDVVLA